MAIKANAVNKLTYVGFKNTQKKKNYFYLFLASNAWL